MHFLWPLVNLSTSSNIYQILIVFYYQFLANTMLIFLFKVFHSLCLRKGNPLPIFTKTYFQLIIYLLIWLMVNFIIEKLHFLWDLMSWSFAFLPLGVVFYLWYFAAWTWKISSDIILHILPIYWYNSIFP